MDLSYLELEGQGQGITPPLLLGQFHQVKWPVTPNKSAGSVTARICLKYIHQCSNFSRLCFIKPLNQLLVNPMQNLITYLIYNTKSIQLPLQLTKYMLVRDRCHFRWKISWHLDVLGITNSQFLIFQPLMWTVRFQLRTSNLYTCVLPL